MELALLLIILCLIDTFIAIWLLARQRAYFDRLAGLQRDIDSVIHQLSRGENDLNTTMETVANTTNPQDLANALTYLNSLVDKD